MLALEKAWEPHTHSVTPMGNSESKGGAEHPLWKMPLPEGGNPPGSALTLLLAHWEATNRGIRPDTSAAPLEGCQVDANNDRTTSWGCCFSWR